MGLVDSYYILFIGKLKAYLTDKKRSAEADIALEQEGKSICHTRFDRGVISTCSSLEKVLDSYVADLSNNL